MYCDILNISLKNSTINLGIYTKHVFFKDITLQDELRYLYVNTYKNIKVYYKKLFNVRVDKYI